MSLKIFLCAIRRPDTVINASAFGVIHQAKRYPNHIGTVFAGKNGIIGALKEELINTATESDEHINQLQFMPGSAFGSCRYKLKNSADDNSEYRP